MKPFLLAYQRAAAMATAAGERYDRAAELCRERGDRVLAGLNEERALVCYQLADEYQALVREELNKQ